MFINYISIPTFFISFFIGILFIYIYGPEYKKVYIYPSIDIINTTLYRDNANNCFRLETEEVNCSNNKNEYFHLPLQI